MIADTLGSRTVTLVVLSVGGTIILSLCLLHRAGARINITQSLPQGLYWTIDKQPEKGDIVTFKPPSTAIFLDAMEKGYIKKSSFSFGPGPLLKRIAASAGDYVTITMEGITINGKPLKNASVRGNDGEGRPLTPWLVEEYQLAENEVFLFSDFTQNSFDSRYFGVQQRHCIQDVVKPVLIYIPSF